MACICCGRFLQNLGHIASIAGQICHRLRPCHSLPLAYSQPHQNPMGTCCSPGLRFSSRNPAISYACKEIEHHVLSRASLGKPGEGAILLLAEVLCRSPKSNVHICAACTISIAAALNLQFLYPIVDVLHQCLLCSACRSVHCDADFHVVR